MFSLKPFQLVDSSVGCTAGTSAAPRHTDYVNTSNVKRANKHGNLRLTLDSKL